MADLVTLSEAKQAARITVTDEDSELDRLLDECEELVLDAIKNRVSDSAAWTAAVDAWTEVTAPKSIKGAILHQFVAAERLRGGDDPKLEPLWSHGLAPRAWSIVQKYRDPSVA